ncbi:MAG: tetratricopeptide repeat protein, partial [Candidatus Zixiibacteriota bacterium]
IGKELGVEYILEGTIKWERFDDENRVRIQPQLIKVDDDIYLWSASYDAVLKEIFELQSRIAREVVNSLNITLMLPERERLDSRVTDNIEAYNYYLQGKNYFDNAVPVSKDEELAIQMFEHAVALDTMFSEAYSWLAHLHAWIHFNTLDRTGQQLTLSKKAAEKAVRFSGNGAAGKSAMGYYYYYGLRDYEAALREFNDALKLQPNNSELLSAIGFVQRRLGLWDEALANLVKASQLDPLSPARILQVVLVLNPTRRNKECLEILDKGIALSPDNGLFYVHKFYVLYNLHEDLDELRELLETASKNFVPNQQVYTVWETYYMWRRDYKAAAAVQPALSNDIYRDTVDFYLAKAIIFMLMKDERASHAYADSVREILEKCITLQPDYYEHYANLGIALALLGRKPEAIEAGQKAVGILPVQKDAYRGFRQLNWLALIYTFVGEKDLALDAVDSLLSIPSFVTVPKLKIDPVYDPLRDHPRFKVIIEKYEKECYGT